MNRPKPSKGCDRAALLAACRAILAGLAAPGTPPRVVERMVAGIEDDLRETSGKIKARHAAEKKARAILGQFLDLVEDVKAFDGGDYCGELVSSLGRDLTDIRHRRAWPTRKQLAANEPGLRWFVVADYNKPNFLGLGRWPTVRELAALSILAGSEPTILRDSTVAEAIRVETKAIRQVQRRTR